MISALEHHSNIVPWQMLRERGVRLVVAPVDTAGGFDLPGLERCLGPRTRLVALTHVANVTGEMLPVEAIVRLAHACGAKVLLDGCQAAPRLPVDVAALDCDFYAFSGHKCYGPTGIGALYGKRALLEAMPPWQGGGDMIITVTFDETLYQAPPHRFEAGTPDISGAVGPAAALDFMTQLDRDAIAAHERSLTGYARARLAGVAGVRLVGPEATAIGVVSFTVESVHPHDLATVLDQHALAIRAGHHCAQLLMDRLGLAATARVSFGVYNDEADVDALIAAVEAAQRIFGG